MKLPRDLAGDELADHLCKFWAYQRVHQVGSHVILQTQTPSPQRIAIPAHKALRIGTLNSIVREVARHKQVDREAILDDL